ncbi:protein arginine N-methyltransferase 1-like isoform X2 [Panulirus ornatus]|uniref:protein arginine N-methyltransferase 1-like isoform X2 n=1 Tax=Panulirus ornatus TaxID=150431 RepID=UPI003A8BD5B8
MKMLRLMVTDSPRTKAYYDAINSNKHLFQGKVAMDVGAGTGILSLFMAAAGAKKVYAVEASGMAAVIQKVADDNGFADIIHIYHSKVEDISLPGNEKVDIIVSEWMGFYLLHESMLNSVIQAREHFLAEDGTVFPSEARIYACPCSLKHLYEEQISFWDNVYGFNMSAVKHYALKSKMTKPEVRLIPQSDLLAEPSCVKKFNLRWVTEEEVKFFAEASFVAITKSGTYQGLCLWFECDFDGRDFDEDGKEFGSLVKLSTSPFSPGTHWKQTVVVLGYGADETNQELKLTSQDVYNEGDLHTGTENSGNKLFCNETRHSNMPCNQQANCHEKFCKDTTHVMEQAINEPIVQPSFGYEVEQDEVVGWKLILAQSDNNVRHYTMTVEMLDPETEEHQVPCHCPMPQCLIIAQMLEKEMKEDDDFMIDCT